MNANAVNQSILKPTKDRSFVDSCSVEFAVLPTQDRIGANISASSLQSSKGAGSSINCSGNSTQIACFTRADRLFGFDTIGRLWTNSIFAEQDWRRFVTPEEKLKELGYDLPEHKAFTPAMAVGKITGNL